jgi:hypothetical protein
VGTFPQAETNPVTILQGADGSFYGLTDRTAGIAATVYKMTQSGTLSVLHTFPGNTSANSLLQGSDGNFYGIQDLLRGRNRRSRFLCRPTVDHPIMGTLVDSRCASSFDQTVLIKRRQEYVAEQG